MNEIQKIKDKIEACRKDIQRLIFSDLSNDEMEIGIVHNRFEIAEYEEKLKYLEED